MDELFIVMLSETTENYVLAISAMFDYFNGGMEWACVFCLNLISGLGPA